MRVLSSTVLSWTLATSYIGFTTATDMAVSSPMGRKLLENAKEIQPASHLRRLDDQEQDYFNDLPFLYIQYLGCSSYENQYNYNNNNNNNNGENEEEEDASTDLIRFTLCSEQNCGGSCSGEYAVEMVEFLNMYVETQQQAKEQQCEYVKQHCYCYNGNSWSTCLYNCYSNAGILDCYDYGGDGGDGGEGGGFQLQEYLECREAYGGNGEGDNNNNNNNNQNGQQQFFVGPYCANNTDIFLRAYYDEYCSVQADSSYFLSLNYGNGFPYFDEAILGDSACFSCMDYEQENNGDDYNPEANELCRASTEEAIYQCDPGRGLTYGCYFLNDTLPCMDGRGCPEEESDSGSFFSWGGGDSALSSLSDRVAYDKMSEHMVLIVIFSVSVAVLLISMLIIVCCSCWTGPAFQDLETKQQKQQKKSPLLTLSDPIMRDRSNHSSKWRP